ncbi:MAG: cell division protein SepF [Lachnospiraceae bacterium]|nr:cell division protein SepF [Lachnospiraceae bacterium]
MKVFDKFMDVMRLSPDDDDDLYDDYYDDDDDDEEDLPKKSLFHKKEKDDTDSVEDVPTSRERLKPVNKITPIRNTKKNGNGSMAVCVIKPTGFEDAREITDTLLGNRTVVLNVEGLDVDIAQRIIDFASGSCYAMNGNLQKISNYIFIITPESVDISGDFQEILDNFSGASIQTDFIR